MTLSAFSLPSFAGGIAGVASDLPLGFHGGFPRGPLSEFRVAGLLFRFQRGLTSGSLGDLRSGQGSSLTSFNGQSWMISDIYLDGAVSEVATRRTECAFHIRDGRHWTR